MRRYARDLKDIVDLYNLKSDSDTSKKSEGLKILNNKQMLNLLPMCEDITNSKLYDKLPI